MVRVALSQVGRTPIFVSSFDELRASVRESDAACTVVSADDLAQAGITPTAAISALGGVRIVFLAPGNVALDIQGSSARVVKIPFSAAELRQAVDVGERPRRETVPTSPTHTAPDLTELVRAEIERIVRERAESMLADAVMKIVPELAEVMIKAELDRLLADEGERAVSQDPQPVDD